MLHEQELRERPEMESELHHGVLSSVQQLLEEEAPEWAGPEDVPVVQSSQWGFSCPGRWADELLTEEDAHEPWSGELHQSSWFEPQRSNSIGHAPDMPAVDESKRRSRKKSKRRKNAEHGESTIRVLQLEQLLMLDERLPSFSQLPAPVGKQAKPRAISQPPLYAKAKASAPSRPRKADAKAKAGSQPETKPPKRRPYQSFYQMPEALRARTNSGKDSTDAWRIREDDQWRVRSPDNLINPEAVLPKGQFAAPEHVGEEQEGRRVGGHAGAKPSTVPQGSTFHSQPRNSEARLSENRRRPRSRPKTPKPSVLPQRSGRAWRAGRKPSNSDPQGPLGPGRAEAEEKRGRPP